MDEEQYVSIDIGGTFTDLIFVTSRGISALKVPSTPGCPEQGVIRAIEESGVRSGSFIHGSTVATNAILERKAARTALVSTSGFSDVIEIGRQNRPRLYRLDVEKPEALVGRNLRFDVEERTGPGGDVLKRLSRAEARRVAEKVASIGADSAAVCLLFSFEGPRHEELIAEELEKLGIPASISSRVLPEFREYERASTTVINAYVQPVMNRYLDRLTESIGAMDSRSRLRMMHSAGGTLSPHMARRRPAGLILSGPAGGVVAAGWLGRSIGLDRVISFDMGGTSTDVSLVDRDLTVTRETKISGLPIALPMIDIHTIGAGGGSIARVDDAGVLKVGPESAGSDPGPACYGEGMLPTVTDANMALGRLEADWFLGGRMEIDPERSLEAIRSLADGRDPVRTAGAVLDVSISHMERALKTVSLERGYDPREFALVSFGGAGPMHACELAERLSIPRVIIPTLPGLFSSVGMLLAKPGRDHTRTTICSVEDDSFIGVLKQAFRELRLEAVDEMTGEGFFKNSLVFNRYLSMRYRGQSHEVTVPFERLSRPRIKNDFETVYRHSFGYTRPEETAEVVNIGLSCRAMLPGPAPFTASRQRTDSEEVPEPFKRKRVFFDKIRNTDLYERDALAFGHHLSGPALVLQDDTTTVIPPRWSARVDEMGNLDMEIQT